MGSEPNCPNETDLDVGPGAINAAGQIGKILGCPVVGIAGAPDKCRYVVDGPGNAVQLLGLLFSRGNTGKLLVQIGADAT